MWRTKNQSQHIHDNSPGDSPKDRPRESAYFRHRILPVLEYYTSELVLLSFWILGCQPKASIRNTMLLNSGTTTNDWDRICPLMFFEEPLQEAAARSFFCGAGSWNHDAFDHEMATALIVLQRLFLLTGDKWGLDQKPVTSSINSADGWPLIGQPITSLKWPPRWRHQICVEIRSCEGGSK